jgi:hypothetical protein
MTGLDAVTCSADAVIRQTNKTLHFVKFGSLRAQDFLQTLAAIAVQEAMGFARASDDLRYSPRDEVRRFGAKVMKVAV